MKQGDFTALAKNYINRPAYSGFLLEKLFSAVNESNKARENFQIVEVGAGTGKLTKMLAQMGFSVIAVEPNDAMRAEGEFYTKGLNVKWQKGSGEETGVQSDIADWVIMASSFHWTDPKKSLPEFARVLKGGNSIESGASQREREREREIHRGDTTQRSDFELSKSTNENFTQDGIWCPKNSAGYFTAIWNPRHIVEGSIFYEIENEIRNIVPELARVSSGAQNTKAWEQVLISTGDFDNCFFSECDYTEIWSKERYLGAWESVNDIRAQAGELRWAQIMKMIKDKIGGSEFLEIPYKIRAWSVRKV